MGNLLFLENYVYCSKSKLFLLYINGDIMIYDDQKKYENAQNAANHRQLRVIDHVAQPNRNYVVKLLSV